MTDKKDMLEECVEYFKARPVYRKLFQKARDKYRSLGHLGGTIVLTGLDREEKDQLSGFFQKDYTENKSVSISAKTMERCLRSSRFSEVRWEDILEAYFKEPLTTKKEEERQRLEKRESFFLARISRCQEGEGKRWLNNIWEEKKEGYLFAAQLYKESPEKLSDILEHLMRAIDDLPAVAGKQKPQYLAVFAAQITGDPHYFDEGRVSEKLLFSYLRDRYAKPEWEEFVKAEYKYRIYYEAGILKDEVSNDVLAYGIHGCRADGTFHEGIEGFLRSAEPVKLTLQTIGNLESVYGQKNEVYIVENPTVFSVLVSEFPNSTIICGNGQLRLAVLALMDRFPRESVFRYAGDFDPEGLLIAQRLKIRYGERLQLWNYRVSWYEAHLSEVKLDIRRLRKLEKVCVEELQEIKAAICREGRAAYQEAMIGEICALLKNM